MTHKMSVKGHVKMSAFNVFIYILSSLKNIVTVKKITSLKLKIAGVFLSPFFVV